MRNRISQVLRDVEKGEAMRITVDGRAVADLVPAGGARREFVPRARVERLIARAPLDRKFAHDLNAATGGTIDDL
ncbi:MAG TPA: hypothetical protein VND20_11645 [Candidatus Binataceae bacterium]|nr:hypothetical protein [Candidatus Binataceae bacterium]